MNRENFSAKLRRNGLLWLGFFLSLAAFFSYFVFFVRFPATRDVPWVNLLLFAAALLALGVGIRRAFRQPTLYRGKITGPILLLLSGAVLGLFLFFNLHWSRLPVSAGAPRVGQKAPDFVLPDQNGEPVQLSRLLEGSAGQKGRAGKSWVLLVFYRGYW